MSSGNVFARQFRLNCSSCFWGGGFSQDLNQRESLGITSQVRPVTIQTETLNKFSANGSFRSCGESRKPINRLTVGKGSLEKFAECLLKLRFAAGAHLTADGNMDGHKK